MCRLFGLSAGHQRVEATFWLLDAPDSLVHQSHTNPDGTGLGTFDDSGQPVIEKQPIAAYADDDFSTEARTRASATFVAHVRRSSGTALTEANTHPFAGSFRIGETTIPCIFAHNGVIGDVPALEAHLGHDMTRVHGDTDSERWFALICREIEAAGDIVAGITTAAEWIAAHVPVISANFILATADEIFALRYPDTRELYLLERTRPVNPLRHRSQLGTRVESDHLASTGSVVIASERLDGEDWQEIAPGELVCTAADLTVTRRQILPGEGAAGHPEHSRQDLRREHRDRARTEAADAPRTETGNEPRTETGNEPRAEAPAETPATPRGEGGTRRRPPPRRRLRPGDPAGG